ncbi:MAG: PssE/Cps14G family polysaccharide biosynthesis glycosyltransferase [Candidatus Diapherotrites archaeon]
MIFVTTGTHTGFDRLLREVDKIAGIGKIKDEFVVELGNSGFEPKNFKKIKFLPRREYLKNLKNSDLVIIHGGSGSVLDVLINKKKAIIVPRLKKFREHENDHQMDLAQALEKSGRALAVYKISDLTRKIIDAKNFSPKFSSEKSGLINALEEFISQ